LRTGRIARTGLCHLVACANDIRQRCQAPDIAWRPSESDEEDFFSHNLEELVTAERPLDRGVDATHERATTSSGQRRYGT
jgi:hypothetical protein